MKLMVSFGVFGRACFKSRYSIVKRASDIVNRDKIHAWVVADFFSFFFY